MGANPRRRPVPLRRGQAEGLIERVGSKTITIDDVQAAASRLEPVAHRTPVVRSRTLDQRTGAEVLLKCESLQRGGAFKFRGAYNAIAQLPADALQRGVTAYSSGNHAQAVALAARILGTQAVIVMPEDTPASKLAATRGYGAEIVTYDRYREDRTAIAAELATERRMALIPPYDHPDVIAGQGTVALELIDQVGEIDALIVPVGGGGLIAGCAIVVDARSPGATVVGVEPEHGDDTKRSLDAGERVAVPVPRTIADGQAVETPGALTFEINRRLVDRIALVTDAEVVEAMRFLFERTKLVAEPSGASALAALLSGRLDLSALRVGVIVSGGNVSADRFGSLVGGRS